MVSKIAKIAGFLAVLAIVLTAANATLRFSHYYGIATLDTLHGLPQGKVDVAFVGSSHVYNGVNTGTLWSEYGIAAYDATSDAQSPTNSYYYLKDLLKTQHPRLVVLDVYGFAHTSSKDQALMKSTFGLTPGLDKLEAKKVNFGDKPEFVDYVLEFPSYHQRYSNLTRKDFKPFQGKLNGADWKGHEVRGETFKAKKNPNKVKENDKEALSDNDAEWLEKFISLAHDAGAEVLLVSIPYNVTKEDLKVYNTVEEIARDNGAAYLDCNAQFAKTGLDFTSDESDLANEGHLNYRGSVKFSDYLGRKLKESYDIPDHRGDAAYESWDIDAKTIDEVIADFETKGTKEFLDWLERVSKQGDRTLVLSFPKKLDDDELDSDTLKALQNIGIEDVEHVAGRTFVLQDGVCVHSGKWKNVNWHSSLYDGVLELTGADDGVTIRFGYNTYNAPTKAITAFLYDDSIGQLVEVAKWNKDKLHAKKKLEPVS